MVRQKWGFTPQKSWITSRIRLLSEILFIDFIITSNCCTEWKINNGKGLIMMQMILYDNMIISLLKIPSIWVVNRVKLKHNPSQNFCVFLFYGHNASNSILLTWPCLVWDPIDVLLNRLLSEAFFSVKFWDIAFNIGYRR